MKLLILLKLLHYRLWTGRRKAKRLTQDTPMLRLVPRETTTTTSVHWPAQYHYKPATQEKEVQP